VKWSPNFTGQAQNLKDEEDLAKIASAKGGKQQ
jgi:hypothetical protein